MSRQYPIWHDVSSCIYSSSKSWGARDTSTVSVYVGTSKSNSELLVKHTTTRRAHGPDWTVFTFGVDTGKGLAIVARKYMHNKTHEWRDTDPLEAPRAVAEPGPTTITVESFYERGCKRPRYRLRYSTRQAWLQDGFTSGSYRYKRDAVARAAALMRVDFPNAPDCAEVAA